MSADVRHSRRGFALFAATVMMGLTAGCFGGKGAPSGVTQTPPTANTVTITVDGGPAASPGAFNHPYVTVRVCAAGSTSQCANIDHVLVDTGSWGLRLIRSTLTAAALNLSPETDAQGNTIEECATFGGGQTWGPVALADITLAGEKATKLPVQVFDDTQSGAPPPATCGSAGLINRVTDWSANGVLGIGVFAQDCGPACAGTGTALPEYYGCTAAGVCTAENVALAAQVTNPAWAFSSDNNGLIVVMPNLVNANGDPSVQGQLLFGLETQADNSLPATAVSLLAADANGHFQTAYNGSTTPIPAVIDSGTDDYRLDDPSIPTCSSATWVGYYCPTTAPLVLTAVNTSASPSTASVSGPPSTITFSLSIPDTFVANQAAYGGLAGGQGSTVFGYGMPFFYGRSIYIGFEGRQATSFTGPFYGY